MERTVTFRDDQEFQAVDMTNLQTFTQESLDDLVFDTIEDGMAYAGFGTTATGTTQVTTQPGRLYSAGKVSISLDAIDIPLFADLPSATLKKVAIVTWATEQDFDTQARDFLLNVDTGATQPQAVTMEHRRVANIAAVQGVESPDPQVPVLASNLLAVCIVTLNTTGIQSIEMVAANRVPRLSDLAQEVADLEAWRETVEPRITTIATDITNIANQVSDTVANRDLFQLYADVARLKAIEELPSTYSAYGADRFLDDSETDTTNVNLLCKIEEGVRFSDANAGLSALQIFNPLDPNAVISNGLMLPTYSNVTRMSISSGYVGDLSISQYGYQTVTVVQKSMSRQRIRYGSTYTYCTNSAWWKSGTYDPVTHIFTRQGETFIVLNPDLTNQKHGMIRLEQFWVDTYQEPYWDYVTTNYTINGALVAQSFLNSQEGWLTQVGFWLTRRAASGNINVTICETTNGAPDLTKAIMQTTVDYTALQLNTWTIATIPPTYLKAGTRYAMVLTTNANHWVAMASGNTYSQGTFFYSTDGAFYQGDLTKDMYMLLNFAKFANPRVVIQLAALQLDGGMAAIDINADCIISAATQLIYEVQIGGNWIALTDVDTQALIGLPPLVPLRVTFVGTSDVMPGLKLLGSQVEVSRPRTTFKHISIDLIRVSTTQIKVQARYENWNDANHSVACSLLTGAGFTTVVTPDATETLVESNYSIKRTYTFNLGAAVSDYKIVFDGTTTSALDVFHVAERVDVDF